MPRAQLIAIFGVLALFVLLLFANTIPPRSVKTEGAELTGTQPEYFETAVQVASDALLGENKARVSEWQQAFNHATTNQKLNLCDSLIKVWDGLKRPDLAAYYAEQKAVLTNSTTLWNNAGERYYNAVRFTKNEGRAPLYRSAMNCFEKVLSKDPGNLDAKTNLGACYVESTSDPMKGIGLLREVVTQDSMHINAQLNLAFFSVKSGQYEKAIERFSKVLSIKPDYLEAYLFLADTYEREGNKQKAIEILETYIGLVDDVTIKNEVKNYINKLKTG